MFDEICQLCGMVKGDCECSKNAAKNNDSDNSVGVTSSHMELMNGQATSAIHNLVKNGKSAAIEEFVYMVWGAWESDRIDAHPEHSVEQSKLFVANLLNKWATEKELF